MTNAKIYSALIPQAPAKNLDREVLEILEQTLDVRREVVQPIKYRDVLEGSISEHYREGSRSGTARTS